MCSRSYMVLITEHPGVGLKVRQNGAVGRAPVTSRAQEEVEVVVEEEEEEASGGSPERQGTGESECSGLDCTYHYWEEEDDIYQELEELDFEALPDYEDTRSVASDDSFYPPPDSSLSPSPDGPEPVSLFSACSNNNTIIVKIMIRQGVLEEEVWETDRNRRSGLIVACYHGYVDVVMALAQCPYIDVNWQDNEGNTALIIAAQAGHLMICNFLLNYFPGLDIERRNCHGFTATMKAAMQGRAECVRALMLSGGDLEARDYGRKKTPREWAVFTGRYDTVNLMERLMAQPCAQQFCTSFCLEWPMLEELVATSQEPESCWRRFSNACLCCPFTRFLGNKIKPMDNGVLDHMVQVTTGLSSPFVATACHTVCPGSPPCVGKRRLAVQEILRRQRADQTCRMGPQELSKYKRLFQKSRELLVPRAKERRASLPPQLLWEVAAASTGALRRASLLPVNMLRRSSVRPGLPVPEVRLCKAPETTYAPEKDRGRAAEPGRLDIPRWRYAMKREERKRQEEEERQKRMKTK